MTHRPRAPRSAIATSIHPCYIEIQSPRLYLSPGSVLATVSVIIHLVVVTTLSAQSTNLHIVSLSDEGLLAFSTISNAAHYAVEQMNSETPWETVSTFPAQDTLNVTTTVSMATGLELYRVVATMRGGQDGPDLVMSEYAEGSGLNKAIEIYNPHETSVDLDSVDYIIDQPEFNFESQQK